MSCLLAVPISLSLIRLRDHVKLGREHASCTISSLFDERGFRCPGLTRDQGQGCIKVIRMALTVSAFGIVSMKVPVLVPSLWGGRCDCNSIGGIIGQRRVCQEVAAGEREPVACCHCRISCSCTRGGGRAGESGSLNNDALQLIRWRGPSRLLCYCLCYQPTTAAIGTLPTLPCWWSGGCRAARA